MTFIQIITSQVVPEAERMAFVGKLFGINYVLRLEPTVFDMAGSLAADYAGGYWQFYALSNGGFYMAPKVDTIFNVSCENGYVGKLSADALGITACLYAYSHLSFSEGELALTCARLYHWLREYMSGHAEVRGILRGID